MSTPESPNIVNGLFGSLKLPKSAVWVLIATTYAYMTTYIYEVGFLHTFSVSDSFIQISPIRIIPNVIITTLGLLAVELLYSTYQYSIFGLKYKNPTDRFKIFFGQLFFIALSAFFILILLSSWKPISVFLAVFGTYVAVLCLFILLISYDWIKSKSFNEALRLYWVRSDKESQKIFPTKNNAKIKLFNFQNLKFAVLLLIVIVVAYILGINSGNSQATYPVLGISGAQDTIMIRDYNNILVLKTYNTNSKQLNTGYTIKVLSGSIEFKGLVTIPKR